MTLERFSNIKRNGEPSVRRVFSYLIRREVCPNGYHKFFIGIFQYKAHCNLINGVGFIYFPFFPYTMKYKQMCPGVFNFTLAITNGVAIFIFHVKMMLFVAAILDIFDIEAKIIGIDKSNMAPFCYWK